MNSATASAESLRKQIAATEDELKRLKEQLACVEAQDGLEGLHLASDDPVIERKWPLSAEEYRRYGRQMIVPSIGIDGMKILVSTISKDVWTLYDRIKLTYLGQLRLKNASVLIIGAGGLGCPAAAYLTGAGVGTIGIVDGDIVETSNLHRQILHSTAKVGMKKVDSAISYLKA